MSGRCLSILLLALSALAPGKELALPGYQRADGAITVQLHGDRVDPYFAAKALLAAADAGLDARQPAQAWIAWALAHQRGDGRFQRFCLRPGQVLACADADADADDAMLALWLELLVRFAPAGGLPPAWQDSVRRASHALLQLRDPHSGVFVISQRLPIALLMDNAEVYSALRALSRYYQAHGEPSQAGRWAARAVQLQAGIQRVFWDRSQRFRISTQPRTEFHFYPDAVAQLFPLLAGLPVPGQRHDEAYAGWMLRYRERWLQHARDDFPWGLVALLSARQQDHAMVACWRARAMPFRHGQHWNVLEEALYLAFDASLDHDEKLAPAC